MNDFELTAKNPRQLDICLKLLHAQKIYYLVRIEEISETKVIYLISVDTNEETFEKIADTYRILIS